MLFRSCVAVGLKAGDRITAIDNNTINNTTDLRLALWDKQPGDTISIDIVRKRLQLFEEEPELHAHAEITCKNSKASSSG